MKTQYTPGDWKLSAVPTVSESGMVSFHVFAPGGYVVAETGASNIRETLGQAWRNAHLISAAPDMIEALEEARDWINHLAPRSIPGDGLPGVAIRIANAIDKARSIVVPMPTHVRIAGGEIVS